VFLVIARFRLSLAALALLATLASSCRGVTHPPAAVVDGVRITDGELRDELPALRFLAALQQVPCGQAGSNETASSACTRFALSELIQGSAAQTYASAHHVSLRQGELANALTSVEQRFGGHEALLKQLAHEHVTYGQLSRLVSQILLVNRIAPAVTEEVIPTRELEHRYQEERLRFTLLHVAHIVVRTRALAERIARRATPSNFAALAKKYSTDPSGRNGGDLGVNRAATFAQADPAFAQAALSLQPGQISGPVHTRFGWDVIRLLGVRVIPFDQAKTEVVSEFVAQGFAKWLAGQSGRIDVNPRYGRFDPASGRVALVCSTSATQACPSPSPSPSGP
jgi:PPIC-type peptidyl-prolyl cis-trans isomerase-like protein